jgi:tRNA(Ile)-lysidine synthase
MSLQTPPTWLTGVERQLRRWTKAEDRLLAGVSGGADSVGMLAVLTDALGLGARVAVCYVDHGIRPDTDEDVAIVRGLCAERRLQFLVKKVDTPELARSRQMSLEVAGRRLRYEALGQTAQEHSCRWILTGHTQDDSAETVLLRMLGGGSWYEWTGIPSRRGQVLRPLIDVPRAELRRWVLKRGLPWREDPTNADMRHTRNRLRMAVLRKPEFWCEDRVHELAHAGQLLWWGIEGCRWLSRRTFLDAQIGSGAVGLEIERILGYFSSLSFVAVEVAWAQCVGRAEARLPSAVRQQIPPFLLGKSPQSSLVLPEGIIAHRRGGRVWLYRESAANIALRVGMGENSVAERGATLTLGFTDPHEADYRAAIDPQCAERDLYLRNWRPGDRLKVAGRPTKKVADLLAESKLDPLERARVLVLADDSGPLLMIGGPVAERALPQHNEVNPLWVSWKASDGT